MATHPTPEREILAEIRWICRSGCHGMVMISVGNGDEVLEVLGGMRMNTGELLGVMWMTSKSDGYVADNGAVLKPFEAMEA